MFFHDSRPKLNFFQRSTNNRINHYSPPNSFVSLHLNVCKYLEAIHNRYNFNIKVKIITNSSYNWDYKIMIFHKKVVPLVVQFVPQNGTTLLPILCSFFANNPQSPLHILAYLEGDTNICHLPYQYLDWINMYELS